MRLTYGFTPNKKLFNFTLKSILLFRSIQSQKTDQALALFIISFLRASSHLYKSITHAIKPPRKCFMLDTLQKGDVRNFAS